MVVVFDRSDSRTIDAVNAGTQKFPCRLKFITVDNGEVALSRNNGIDAADGDFIVTADADDLVSANLITAMRQALLEDPNASLVLAEYFAAFGDERFVNRLHGSRDVPALALLDSNPFMSRAMFRREVFAEIRFVATFPTSPYYHEDWHWNCECLAAGRSSIVAKGAAIYYRQRKGSLMDEARKKRGCQIAPSRLFVPEVFCRIAERDYQRRLNGDEATPDPAAAREVFRSLEDDISVQSKFEPGLSLKLIQNAPIYDNRFATTHEVGASYYEICRLLVDRTFADVFIWSFHTSGDDGVRLRATLAAFYEIAPRANILVIFLETTHRASAECELPANASIINLGRDWAHLTIDERWLIILKLVQSTARTARLHVCDSSFCAGFLDVYRALLRDNALILYPSFATQPASFGARDAREHSTCFVDSIIDSATYLIVDDAAMIARYAATSESVKSSRKWRVLAASRINVAEFREKIRPLFFAELGLSTGSVAMEEEAGRRETESARQRELIETLEAGNAELRRILQVERERFAQAEPRAKFDGRVTIVNGDVWVEGRVLPAKVFRRIAKLWSKPVKRFVARLALAALGARV
jgi:glycosyltransferase involved in cell wall biosynthesis